MNTSKLRLFTITSSAILLLANCTSGFKYSQTEHSLIVTTDSLQTEITVVDEDIVRVQKDLLAKPGKEMPDFVTVLKPQDVKWTVSEQDDNLVLSTAKMQVLVNQAGEVSYRSVTGKSLLSETNAGTYINTDTLASHRVAQAFKAGDEALYGLGQYQSGRMNWKNAPVRMEQSNQEIAIPVLVSTNQYGIYWNNYSITDFNLPDNEITFTETIDKENSIRKATFTPKKSGVYNFYVLSETPYGFKKKFKNKNRQWGPVLVTLNNDTIIHYSTMWYPDSFSGEAKLEAGKKYEVVFQNTHEHVAGRLLYNEPDFNKSTFTSKEGESIDYYFVYGETPAEVVATYSRLTGHSPMLPKKTYGFWQCREAYPTQKELLASAHGYRDRKIPVDIIVQDWNYWYKNQKGPNWDRARYPKPMAMARELDEMNLDLLVSVWPEVVSLQITKKYGMDKNYMTGARFIDFYDFSTHDKFYKMMRDSMFRVGVDAIWLDGSEPARSPDPNHPTPFGKYSELANTYSLIMSKAMHEGHRKEYKNKKRTFNFTRSAYAGQQRYGTCMWSGDVAATWEQFQEQITAGLNFTMTGVPYWTTDIGGFFRDHVSKNDAYDNQYTNPEYKELLTRWFQFGTFCPIFRIHGFRSHTEIWNYGKAFESTARKFIDLRYKLMPYIYSEAWSVTKDARVLMSPLAYSYPNDKHTWNNKYQFMFGQSLMVCPITEYKAREREVYLPKGDWYDFWTDKKIAGEQTITSPAALNSQPMFVKAGSIIPMGPKVQYATQKTDKPITLKVYPGKNAQYTLYFDDNKSYNYEKGKYTELRVFYKESDRSVTVTQGDGSYIDFAETPQAFVIELAGEGVKAKAEFVGKTLTKKI